jgi:isopentenyl diphosphate isomerase/L-lactate dehydrogenase-like FMN-dependent dehydrogenase
MDIKHVWDEARKKLAHCCKVCPVCDGAACAGEYPGMGGIGTGESFMENIRALAAWKLNLRTLHDEAPFDTTLDLWGITLTSPVMGAPMGGASLHLGGIFSEEELIEAMQTGCQNAGTLLWTGDSVDPAFFTAGLALIKRCKGKGIATIKPKSVPEILRNIRMAEEVEALAVAIDMDAAGLQAMLAQGLPVGPLRPTDITAIVSATHLPVILKGIMTPDEADLAASLGVAGIVVSNHGGRVLESSLGTADVLPGIAAAVKGKIRIFFDGGIRSGADVLKALALGAEGVLIGRPLLIAAAGGGARGVSLYMRGIQEALVRAMTLTGVSRVSQVSAGVWPARRVEVMRGLADDSEGSAD